LTVTLPVLPEIRRKKTYEILAGAALIGEGATSTVPERKP
jgi:hypothetical protein